MKQAGALILSPMTDKISRGRPRQPENLAGELELIDLDAIARTAQRRLWDRARDLLDRRELTVEAVATALDVSASTVHRNTRAGSRVGAADAVARERSERP
jgi:AraC-like DNA-binding protein